MRAAGYFSTILFSIFLSSCDSEKEFTQASFIDFARKIEVAIATNNVDYLLKSFSLKGFEAKYLSSIPGKDQFKKSDVNYYRGEILKRLSSIFDRLEHDASNGGYFKYAKYYQESDQHHHIIFGYYMSSGVNFLDFELTTNDNRISIVDIYNYYSGESLSMTFRNHAHNQLRFGRDGGMYFEALLILSTTEEYVAQKEYNKAWDAINSIPAEFIGDKLFMMMRLEVSGFISQDLEIGLLEYLISKDPENARFNLLHKVNYFSLQERYKDAFVAVDSLSDLVGKDALILLLRGNLFIEQEKYQESLRSYKLLNKVAPNFLVGYAGSLKSAIQNGNYTEATSLLSNIISRFKVSKISLLRQLEGYDDFLNSKEYIEWDSITNSEP